jgi:hypothetical protein
VKSLCRSYIFPQSLTKLSWQVCKHSLKREGISTHVLHQKVTVGLETSGGKGAYLKCMQVHGGPINVPLELAWEAILEKASNRRLASTQIYK